MVVLAHVHQVGDIGNVLRGLHHGRDPAASGLDLLVVGLGAGLPDRRTLGHHAGVQLRHRSEFGGEGLDVVVVELHGVANVGDWDSMATLSAGHMDSRTKNLLPEAPMLSALPSLLVNDDGGSALMLLKSMFMWIPFIFVEGGSCPYSGACIANF